MRERRKTVLVLLIIVLVFICGYAFFHKGDENKVVKTVATKNGQGFKSSSQSKSSEISDLPNVSSDDWNLILVNRDNITKELNPDLAYVDGKPVDARIEEDVKDFLAAAQEIDSREHLISGYRTVEYQKELFDNYVQQEMGQDSSLSEEEAEEKVKTYSQPAGASEHQTGLAIDMSTVDSLNESDASVVEQLKEIAPKYGFVLRFQEDKSDYTGVGYEDWHFRYVGKASARYMTEHNLSLEEYVVLLKENNQ
ncbi:M15 family metallopeptidase [Streptococcus dentapri]|uniref:M15 family metallopeptidase n=1 Tax=Streptococcus dentapri TaxID=573564 RepID=A0ABV8D1P3_9STRE